MYVNHSWAINKRLIFIEIAYLKFVFKPLEKVLVIICLYSFKSFKYFVLWDDNYLFISILLLCDWPQLKKIFSRDTHKNQTNKTIVMKQPAIPNHICCTKNLYLFPKESVLVKHISQKLIESVELLSDVATKSTVTK